MNLFHQLVNKELGIKTNNAHSTKFHSNPAYFFLSTFLSGFLQDCHCFIKTKFHLLHFVLSNPFITKEHKNELIELFCKLQRQYNAFAKFANRWKNLKAKIQVDYDMCLNPIDLKKTPHTIIYQNGAGYIFRIADLINIINSALVNCSQFFVDPLFPKNPYTNIPFTVAMLFHIYTSIRNSDFRMPILFQLFYDAEFDMKRFVYENEATIRDMYIKDFVKNTPSNTLRKNIIEMIYRIDNTHRLRISRDFPTDLLVNIMRPYLYLHLIYTYSLNHSDKKYCSLLKLKRKLKEFINYNPLFGRKKCIPNNEEGYKVVYNIHHVPFDVKDAYDYESPSQNHGRYESDSELESESESESDNDTEIETGIDTEVQREDEPMDSESESENDEIITL